MKTLKKLWSRYWAPSKIGARRLGDACLALAVALAAVSFNDPSWQDKKVLAGIGLLVIGKILTNFTKK